MDVLDVLANPPPDNPAWGLRLCQVTGHGTRHVRCRTKPYLIKAAPLARRQRRAQRWDLTWLTIVGSRVARRADLRVPGFS
jgi:hypothetical protein